MKNKRRILKNKRKYRRSKQYNKKFEMKNSKNLNKNFKTFIDRVKKLIILPIKISYKKLQKLQKVGLFLYIIVSIYRGVFFNPLFFFCILLPPFYLFLLQQRRVKAFIRMRQRDTRVRLKHYYNDFYYVWVFVNTSFIFLAICGLIMYYFEFIENYLSTIGVPITISLDQFQKYTFFYFLFVLGVNWLTNIYIIWCKNTHTFFKALATQEVTLGACIGTYLGFQSFVNLSTPETNPNIHYYYHSFDFFGRGYHFHTARHLEQSNWVKGALGSNYNPMMFLDENKYFDRQRFLGFVWSHRFEIGGELSDAQKAGFPSWIKWAPEVNGLEFENQTVLKDSNNIVIGRMGYDEKQRLVPLFYPCLKVEPLYLPANFDEPASFNKELIIAGTALDSSIVSKDYEYTVSPVDSQESSASSITSVGEIIVPSSKP